MFPGGSAQSLRNHFSRARLWRLERGFALPGLFRALPSPGSGAGSTTGRPAVGRPLRTSDRPASRLDEHGGSRPRGQSRTRCPRRGSSRLSGGINRCEAKASRMRSAARVGSSDPGGATGGKYPAVATSRAADPGGLTRITPSALAIEAEQSRVREGSEMSLDRSPPGRSGRYTPTLPSRRR
jgi:hypothetical protein